MQNNANDIYAIILISKTSSKIDPALNRTANPLT